MVDDEDFDLIRRIPWRISKKGYVMATVYVHRLVTNAESGKTVDHENENKLDNRKSNLSVKTIKDNLHATICRGRNPRAYAGQRKTSRFVGVARFGRKWRATCAGEHLGIYIDEIKAARAYDEAALDRYGPGAFVNGV